MGLGPESGDCFFLMADALCCCSCVDCSCIQNTSLQGVVPGLLLDHFLWNIGLEGMVVMVYLVVWKAA